MTDLDLSWATLALLVPAGLFAGFVNTLAGGGSAVTVPVLMLSGLPPGAANATNRVSVFFQALAGAQGFDRAGVLDRRAVVAVTVPAAVGAAAGALLVTWIPDPVLRPLLLGTMVAIAGLLLLRPQAFAGTTGPRAAGAGRTPRLVRAAAFVAIGLYGGFLQAGVGIVLLAFLSGALGYDLVQANALKAIAVAGFTTVALVVFVAQGLVVWAPALVLTAASVAGARLAVRFAVRAGSGTVRWIVFGMIVVVCGAALVR